MTIPQLPDRGIDIPITEVRRELDECREVDVEILEELQKRPVTTGYLSGRVDQQASYVSKRLAMLREEDVVISLDRGFYEIDPRVLTQETEEPDDESESEWR